MAIKTIMVENHGMIRKEAGASGTITPGHLLMRDSSGYVKVHNAAADVAQKMFAIENDPEGNTITDTYVSTSNEMVQFVVCRPGDVVLGKISANSPSMDIGDYVMSYGDGTLQKYTATAYTDSSAATGQLYYGTIIGQMLEAFTTGTAANAKVEII